MFWAGRDPGETLQALLALGVRCGQLGIPGDYNLSEAGSAWRNVAAQYSFRIYTVFAAYEGESYADISTVAATVGFVPPGTRSAREARTLEVGRFAHEIGAPSIATHIGCVPPDHFDPAYGELVDLVRRICDQAARFEQTFALETGQETAAELLEFIEEVDRPNLAINFDPANMILYGTGEPVEALKLLNPKVVSVHCKDGKWPASPGALGCETALGQGDVNWPSFFSQLESGGYRGPLVIEREAHDEEQRMIDIRSSLEFLRELQLSER
jgi:sugar phosphate isomerase/epimerase